MFRGTKKTSVPNDAATTDGPSVSDRVRQWTTAAGLDEVTDVQSILPKPSMFRYQREPTRTPFSDEPRAA